MTSATRSAAAGPVQTSPSTIARNAIRRCMRPSEPCCHDSPGSAGAKCVTATVDSRAHARSSSSTSPPSESSKGVCAMRTAGGAAGPALLAATDRITSGRPIRSGLLGSVGLPIQTVPSQRPLRGNRMSARIIVVPPSLAEIGEIARGMAPAGFELVVARNDRAEIEAAIGAARVHGLLSRRAVERRVLFAPRRRLKLVPAAQRRLRRRRYRGGAARAGCRSATTAAPTPSRSPSTP